MKNDYNTKSFMPRLVNGGILEKKFYPNVPIYGVSKLVLSILLLFCFTFPANAQYCGPNVPTFTVNLTGNPNGSWISPNTNRNDNCCATTNPDVCVQFVITLDPQSQGILFNIFSGAVPPGALYYQINCGPITVVGQPICLTGVGPHYLTFCKPGNNSNQYIITSIGPVSISPNIILNDGCSGMISATGYDESTVTWTSVFPGAPGAYNSYLSCTTGCDTTTVTAQVGYPPYVDYMVCGTPIGGCSPPICDTVRVSFNPTLFVNITPINPTICFGNLGTWITANGTGGTPPYTYLWSTGATTQSIFVGAGTYTVTLGDASNCPPTTATVTVTAFSNPITANAGPDQSVCDVSPAVQLAGSVTGATGGIWTGGSGTYAPNNITLNAIYTPSAPEITNGQVALTLTTTGNGTCPAASDAMVININNFSGVATLTTNDVTCNGYNNGTANITMNFGNPPYSYIWNTTPAQTTATITGLSPGNYMVTITDGNGCTGTQTITISQPAPLTLNTAGINATCFNLCNGQCIVIPSGGNGNYSYLWLPGNNTNPSMNNACAGSYTVTVIDMMDCSASGTATVSQPTAVVLTTSVTNIICANLCNGSATANVSGGNAPYSYAWSTNPVQSTTTATGLCAGTYSITVTDANSCTTTTTLTITQPAPVTIANITAPVTICFGQGVILSATATGGTGNFTYAWTPSGPNVSPTTTTTYTVIATDANGCTSIPQTVTVTVNPLLGLVATGNVVTCPGTPIQITATANGGNGGPYTYNWIPGNMTGSSVSVSPASTTTYTVTASDNCSPTITTIVQVTVMQSPVVAFNSNNPSACSGSCIQFNCTSTNVTNWSWNFGDGGTSALQNPLYCYNNAGTYSVTLTVTGTNGCTASQTNNNMITIYANPTADFTMTPNPTTILEPHICFTNLSTPDVVQWYWNFNDPNDLLTSTSQNPCHSYSDTGTYCIPLIVHNQYGCWNTVTYCLMIQPYYTIYVPNAFTPNEDGLNDFFFPKATNIIEGSYHMSIFDRWGNLIFQSYSIDKGWDGRANGGEKTAQMDVYVWKIDVKDYTGKGHALTGNVSIIK